LFLTEHDERNSNMPSVQELEQSLTALNGKLATARTAHSAQTERRKKLIDEIGGIASKRATLAVNLARGDAKAGTQIDELDRKEKSLERERQGVDQIISETKAEITTLEGEQGVVNSQVGTIRTAERLQLLIEKLETQEKEFLAIIDRSRVATAEMAITMDELDMMGIHGKRVAQLTAERIWDRAGLSHAHNSGWGRPRILYGRAWQFSVSALLPPGHPAHPGPGPGRY
jgi:hypothetical protein